MWTVSRCRGRESLRDVITCSGGGFNLESIKFVRPQFATNLILATSYGAFRGIKEPRSGIVGHTDDGDWIQYDQIDFGKGVSSVAVELAMGPKNARVEFHLDATNGPLIATFVPASTGDWQTFQIQETQVQGANQSTTCFSLFTVSVVCPTFARFGSKAISPRGASQPQGGVA